MKYKVGDRVKIREDLSVSDANTVARMLMWSGKVMTVRCVGDDYYNMYEDFTELEGEGYFWEDHMIECKVEDEVTQDEKEKFWEGEAKTLGDALFLPLMKEAMKPRVKYNFPTNPDALSSDAMEPDAQPEKIHHPQHYSARNGYECIDIIRIMTKGIDGYEGYLIGNVIKYIFRYNEKNGVEDLKKSIKYLEFLIKEMEKNG